jgi:Tol biopolymer transport system component
MAHSGAAFAFFSVTDGGVLGYHSGASTTIVTSLIWRDREGNEIETLGDDEFYRTVELSPDGTSAAVTIQDNATGSDDLWIFDVERGIKSRFTFSPGADNSPIWSPDGSRIAFASERGGVRSIYVKPVGGADEAELLYQSSEGDMFPDTWTPDGQFIVAWHTLGTGDADSWLIPVDTPAEASPLFESEFIETCVAVSPDGRWAAYCSNESGEFEVYVTTFPNVGRKWQVSAGGGAQPAWRDDGGEIVYLNHTDGMIHSAEVDTASPTFQVGKVKPLFDSHRFPTTDEDWAMTRDGQRFLIVSDVGGGGISGPPVTLVVNFPTELENH